MADWGGAGQGAITGASLGSSFGPIGAGVGGLIGAGAGLLGFGKSKPNKIKQMKNFDPQQLELLDSVIQQAKQGNQNAFQYLNQILSNDPQAMEAFNAPAMQEFEEDIIPSILERYSGMGARSSSALNQSLGRAGQTLATNLNAQRAQLKGNAINQLLGYSQMGLTPKTTPYIKEGKTGALQSMAPAAGQQLANFASNQFGGGY